MKAEEFLNKKPSEMTASELLEFEKRLASVREKKSVCKKCDGRGDIYTENDWVIKNFISRHL
jgi:excinuclease UvrABC ATPase subunit